MSKSLPFPSPVPSLVGYKTTGLDTRMIDTTGETLTVVMKQFFDEVDVGKNHSSTTVPLELELVEGLAGTRVRREGESRAQHSHPSVISLARSSR